VKALIPFVTFRLHVAIRADISRPDQPQAGNGDLLKLGETPHDKGEEVVQGKLLGHLQKELVKGLQIPVDDACHIQV
jgi:hypothetical protein